MYWIAFVLAALALVIFVAGHFGVQRRWVSTNLGLAFLTAAWVVEIVVQSSGSRVVIH
jgi:hypothetical protein